ncbi:elongation factor G [Glycomyces arizonensis]|uniref:elongation factor G n=1 Tax=Glycomyces arizonensis TaxID=256035 RepID=UPI000412CDFC|nr:TetM/TetW/TetO/TetS family tetracycline resistance ribosomal protection protein [Glycomyces arizonensis]
MRTLNLGILAHVDAGKTSLTERLLYEAGVLDAVGSVDDGSTRTDSLDLERRRGITIKAAVVSFELDGTAVNLIDTPGHPDFIAEVERALSVLDGAVLVVSAVEGVQAQTRVLMRALRRLRIPTLVFVNKIDRTGARYSDLLRELAEKLDPATIAMDTVDRIPGPRARVRSIPRSGEAFEAELTDLLTGHDDAFLADCVRDERAATPERLRTELIAQTGRARVFPVHFGSAITGEGVDGLAEGIRHLLPAAEGDPAGPVSGTVFKVERGPAGDKIAYARLFSGTIRVRDRLPFGSGREGKVTAVNVFDQGTDHRSGSVGAGRIAKLWGLDAQIGDPIGLAPKARAEHFSPPTLETVVAPSREADKGALHLALTQLAEADPLIGLRHDERRSELSLSLYGEVQKEVIAATLADQFGLAVDFRESTVICVERPTGSGEAVEYIAKDANPFLATVGLRVDPAPVGSGVDFRLGVELGSMPFAFFKAVEETVHETLAQGLRGWQVRDCAVTMTHSGYWARQSTAHGGFDKSMSTTAGDFRGLVPLVLMDALRQAGTAVHEPIHRFRLDLPSDALGPVLAALAKLRAVPEAPRPRGAECTLEGTVPAASVHALGQRLPSLTGGEGVAESAFERYEPVSGAVPSRARYDHNPLDREEYLLAVVRRVAGR